MSSHNKITCINNNVLTQTLSSLKNNDKINLLLSNSEFINIINDSTYLKNDLVLHLTPKTCEIYYKNNNIQQIQFFNIDIDFKNTNDIKDVIKLYSDYFKKHVINLKIQNIVFTSDKYITDIINNSNIKNIELINCSIVNININNKCNIESINSVLLNKCNDNIYTFFDYDMKLKKICVINMDDTWRGFPHNIFNNILSYNKSTIEKITFRGSATGSYFDEDNFPYKISTLDTSLITFQWYVDIKHERTNFLKTQINNLKYLTIHELPFDFDGGRVFKYIIVEMKLKTFYYKDILLINNAEKQHITQTIEVTEIQIQSLFEIVRQFPSISSIRLNLHSTNVCVEEIEKVVNSSTDIFNNIIKFEINDNTKYGMLGVFSGLFKNLSKIQTLTIKSNDRNINVLLDEIFTGMKSLKKIIYTSNNVSIGKKMFKIIKTLGSSIEYVQYK